MNKTYTSIDEYIATFPQDVQERLITLRKMIHEEVPEILEKISYQMPTFLVGNERLAYFAAWKQHVSFYPASEGMLQEITELREYYAGKGTLQFPHDKDLPLTLIRRLIHFQKKQINV